MRANHGAMYPDMQRPSHLLAHAPSTSCILICTPQHSGLQKSIGEFLTEYEKRHERNMLVEVIHTHDNYQSYQIPYDWRGNQTQDLVHHMQRCEADTILFDER